MEELDLYEGLQTSDEVATCSILLTSSPRRSKQLGKQSAPHERSMQTLSHAVQPGSAADKHPPCQVTAGAAPAVNVHTALLDFQEKELKDVSHCRPSCCTLWSLRALRGRLTSEVLCMLCAAPVKGAAAAGRA